MAIIKSKKKPIVKLKLLDMEIALMCEFGYRRNIIVPNISWGLFLHECDLLVISKTGYATEIEIKTSKADLIKDKDKQHKHLSQKIGRLYFAIPTKLMPHVEHIPERAGIIEVVEGKMWSFQGFRRHQCIFHKTANFSHKNKLTDEEILKAAHLGTMRICGLKQKIRDYKQTV